MPFPMIAINVPQLSQFQSWTDQYGMICNNNQGNSSGNGNLWTAHYVYGIVATNQISDNERRRLLQIYANNFSEPGILCRTPVFPGDRQAQDDYYGLMSAEALLEPTHRFMTRTIYEYGKKSASGIDSTEPAQGAQKRAFWAIKVLTLGRCRWVWNNVQPDRFDETSWLGRFPAFLATMQMSLREDVNLFFWTYWAVSNLWNAWFGSSSDNNGDCLALHSAIASQGYGPITNWICRQVHSGIERKYGSAGGLMFEYFQNPRHPLIALLKDVD
jgi:hypothetical protein